MRTSLPTKRCLLILAAVLFASLLSAQITNWFYGTGYHFVTGASQSLTGYSLNNTTYAPVGKYNLELENRFYYIDKQQPDRQEQTYDLVNLLVERKWDNAYGKVFLRTELIDKPYSWITPVGSFMPYYEKNFTQAGLSGKLNLGPVETLLNARYRSFYFQPVFSFSEKVKDDNLRGDLQAVYEFYKPLAVFVSAYDKAALGSDYQDYDLSTVGTGLKLNFKLSPTQDLTGQTSVEWRKSDFLEANAPDRMIPIYYNLRYSRMLRPDLVGFLNYENRSFYDRENSEFLFNSQFLRGTVKYTLPYDLSLGSFVEVGGKFSPEDEVIYKSSNLLAKTELKVFGKLYLGGGVYLMPERLNNYEAVARYFFTPVSEFFIDYIYQDDVEYNDVARTYAAGVRLLF